MNLCMTSEDKFPDRMEICGSSVDSICQFLKSNCALIGVIFQKSSAGLLKADIYSFSFKRNSVRERNKIDLVVEYLLISEKLLILLTTMFL